MQTPNELSLNAPSINLLSQPLVNALIADAQTLQRANDKGISAEAHLIRSDSFNFFIGIGDLVVNRWILGWRFFGVTTRCETYPNWI